MRRLSALLGSFTESPPHNANEVFDERLVPLPKRVQLLMERGEFEEANALLRGVRRQHPDEDRTRVPQLAARAFWAMRSRR